MLLLLRCYDFSCPHTLNYSIAISFQTWTILSDKWWLHSLMMDRLAGFGRWARMKHWYKCIHETRGTSGDKKKWMVRHNWGGIPPHCLHTLCFYTLLWSARFMERHCFAFLTTNMWPVWFWPDKDIVCNQPTHNSGRKQKYNASQVGDIYIMIDETMLNLGKWLLITLLSIKSMLSF